MEVMGRTRPPVNLVISNVPGPRNPLFLAGAKLEAHYPVSVVVDGVGFNITVMSYLDHLDFGIVADRDQVADVWTLMERLGRALDELTEAVLGKAAVRRAKREAPPRTKARA
jgi:diacylglycerol O-acyltransferase / wax synthase